MKKFMEYVVNNWALILTFILVFVYLIQRVLEFIALPTSKKKAEIKARLLEWVRKAEADLGSKTGSFKLAQVYNQFCGAYPYLKKWFSLDQINSLVKDALAEMESSFANETTKENALNIDKAVNIVQYSSSSAALTRSEVYKAAKDNFESEEIK